MCLITLGEHTWHSIHKSQSLFDSNENGWYISISIYSLIKRDQMHSMLMTAFYEINYQPFMILLIVYVLFVYSYYFVENSIWSVILLFHKIQKTFKFKENVKWFPPQTGMRKNFIERLEVVRKCRLKRISKLCQLFRLLEFKSSAIPSGR